MNYPTGDKVSVATEKKYFAFKLHGRKTSFMFLIAV